MLIKGTYLVAADKEDCYQSLQNPSILENCMPGCQELIKIGEDEYEMKMKMMLASMSALFNGKVKISDQSFPSSFRLIVEGIGKVGFLKGDGLLKLTTQGPGTLVDYTGEIQVGGTISSVGNRLLDTTSRMLIKRFFSKFSTVLQESR
ncbi:MAG: carbon monoxide dehydrogenase subunit G [Acidobacteriia bacterium]|nr:carbon monoxide dehydrogenase subunit G [Terriglobia bacterium]